MRDLNNLPKQIYWLLPRSPFSSSRRGRVRRTINLPFNLILLIILSPRGACRNDPNWAPHLLRPVVIKRRFASRKERRRMVWRAFVCDRARERPREKDAETYQYMGMSVTASEISRATAKLIFRGALRLIPTVRSSCRRRSAALRGAFGAWFKVLSNIGRPPRQNWTLRVCRSRFQRTIAAWRHAGNV